MQMAPSMNRWEPTRIAIIESDATLFPSEDSRSRNLSRSFSEVIMTQDFSAPAGARTITEEPLAPEPMATDGGTSSSTSDVAKEQAGSVAQGAAEAGQQVAGTAKDQASNVAAEASRQAQDLLAQTRNELQEQAATQQQRLASGIRSLSVELGSMAERSEQSGTASEVVRQASAKTAELAGWLDERDPGSLLQEVTSFARRRPGLFLAVAAGAGLAAGRLTRGAVDAARGDSDVS
jgi:uncharacterized phage infection (PIP) family protein YhgE